MLGHESDVNLNAPTIMVPTISISTSPQLSSMTPTQYLKLNVKSWEANERTESQSSELLFRSARILDLGMKRLNRLLFTLQIIFNFLGAIPPS